MKLTLIALPDGQRLEIETLPLVLGRECPELDGLFTDATSREARKHISKKHAVLSCEDGVYYLNDADSLNGTFHNGGAVTATRIPLAPGDLISLARRLELIVDFEPLHTEAPPGRPALVPRAAGPESAPLILDRSPCRLAENDRGLTMLDQPGPDHPDPGQYCRCALRYRNGCFQIALLSPGAAVSIDGRPLSPGPEKLDPGAVITFPSGRSWSLASAEPAARPAPDRISGQTNSAAVEDSTVYIQDATMFMNVFESDAGPSPGTGEPAAAEASGGTDPGRARRPKLKALSLAGAAVILVLLLISGGVYYYRSSVGYQAASLYREGRYLQCFQLAEAALAEADNRKLETLGKKALIKYLAPGYIDNLAANDYPAVDAALEQIRLQSGQLPGAPAILEVLAFVTRVDRFSLGNQQRHDIDDQAWFTDIVDIAAYWDQNRLDYAPVIEEMKQVEPTLEPVFAEFYSNLNANQENKIYYIDKIAGLEGEIRKQLERGDQASARRAIVEFSSRHDKLKNTEKWLEDLDRYTDLVVQLETSDLFELDAVVSAATAQTLMFSNLMADYLQTHLPEDPVRRQLQAAETAWSRGDTAAAVAALEKLTGSPLAERAEQKRQHLLQISSLLETVSTGDEATRCPAVARLLQTLGPGDSQLGRQHRPLFDSCLNRAKQLVEEYRARAAADYQAYRQAGMISGRMRMMPEVTESFRERARLLAAAAAESDFVRQTAALFTLTLDDQVQQLFTAIDREHHAQVARLRESAVLDPPLLQEKLELLRKNEVNGWQR